MKYGKYVLMVGNICQAGGGIGMWGWDVKPSGRNGRFILLEVRLRKVQDDEVEMG